MTAPDDHLVAGHPRSKRRAYRLHVPTCRRADVPTCRRAGARDQPFRGEEGASAPHTLTCMSSRTLGFRPELDRLPTICRALTGFLGAYSRLPGPPGSGLAPGVKVASGNQPSPWRRLSRGSLPRTRCPGGSSVWEVFPVGSRPPASLGRAAMRKLPRGSGAAEFSGSSTNDLPWNDSQDPHGYKLVGTRRKETPHPHSCTSRAAAE